MAPPSGPTDDADDRPADDAGDQSTDDTASGDGWTRPAAWPPDEEIVRAAARAAEDVVLSRLDRGAIADLDVTVRFEEGVLEVDVYVNAPDARGDAEAVADDAALSARAAADDLLEAAEPEG